MTSSMAQKFRRLLAKWKLSSQCIDNVNLPSVADAQQYEFASKRSCCNRFLPSGVAVLADCTIQPSSGFAYSENGQLICAPNWPLKVLLEYFPVKEFVSATQGETELRLKTAFYCLGSSTYNYYHWVTDKLSLIPEYIKYIEQVDPSCPLLCPSGLPSAYYEGLEALGVPSDKVIKWDTTLTKVEHLVMPYANKARDSLTVNHGHRLQWLRLGLLDYAGCSAGFDEPGYPIFVSRNDSADQRVANSKELESRLIEIGFRSITLAGMSLKEQVKLFAQATHVVGLHGAGLTNLIYCQAGTQFVEILPDDYLAEFYADIAKCMLLPHTQIRVMSNELGECHLDIKQVELALSLSQ